MYAAVALVKSATKTAQLDEKGIPVYEINDMMLKGEDEFSVDHPRKLLQEMRERDLLSEYSKGKVAVRDFGDYVTIIEKNSGKPAFVIINVPQEHLRDDMPLYDKSFALMVNESLLQTARELDIDVNSIITEHNLDDADLWEEVDEDEDW